MNTNRICIRGFLAVALGSVLVCRADESVTNFVQNPNLRIVQGNTYNLSQDRSFKTINGKVEEAYDGWLMIRRFKSKPVSEKEDKAFRRSLTDGQQAGAYVSPAASPYNNRPQIPADLVFVTNCPPKAVGSAVILKALPIGRITVTGKHVEGFDCGIFALTPIVTSQTTSQTPELLT